MNRVKVRVRLRVCLHTPCTVPNVCMSYFNKNGEGFRRGRILFNSFVIDVDF
jgi:hypothetical protein